MNIDEIKKEAKREANAVDSFVHHSGLRSEFGVPGTQYAIGVI